MGYKVILVHCSGKERLSRLLDAATGLAAAFRARLVGVSVTPPVAVIPAGMPGSPNVIVLDDGDAGGSPAALRSPECIHRIEHGSCYHCVAKLL